VDLSVLLFGASNPRACAATRSYRLDGKYGLRRLPNANFTLIWSVGGKTPAALEFGKLIVSMSQSPVRAADPVKRQ
jgi:hypothetical protein